MVRPSPSPEATYILQLLAEYSFDVESFQAEAVVADWLQYFEPAWVSQAITEALYQGRYKIVSVDHILQLWQRRGHPVRHFNREFESIVLGQTLLCPSFHRETSVTEPKVTTPRVTEPNISSAQVSYLPEPATAAGDRAEAVEVADQEDWLTAAATPLQGEETTLGSETIAVPDAGPSPSKPLPNFRPIAPEISPAWPQSDTIQPFVPQRETTELHQRLKAVVKGGMDDY
jgi:hypothetical protein